VLVGTQAIGWWMAIIATLGVIVAVAAILVAHYLDFLW
jgi:hypothetical protein